jgi:ABC-type branched-subunit amino acid transport system ATPase component
MENINSPLLAVSNISAGYGHSDIIKNISFQIHPNTITLIVGGNGSGKSTLFKVLSGNLHPRTGEIFLNGIDITGLEPSVARKFGIAYSPQAENVFPSLTVSDNLNLGGMILGSNKKIKIKKDEIYYKFPLLKSKKNKLAGEMSGGERQLLGIAGALMSNPKLLLLDEPSHGLSTNAIEKVLEVITLLPINGYSVCIIEHNYNFCQQLLDDDRFSSKLYQMNEGQLLENLSL